MKRSRTGNTTTSKVILELELVQSGHYMSIHLTEILLQEILGLINSLILLTLCQMYGHEVPRLHQLQFQYNFTCCGTSSPKSFHTFNQSLNIDLCANSSHCPRLSCQIVTLVLVSQLYQKLYNLVLDIAPIMSQPQSQTWSQSWSQLQSQSQPLPSPGLSHGPILSFRYN